MSTAAAPETESNLSRPLPLTLLCLAGWLAVAVAAGRIVQHWDVFAALPLTHVIGAPVALAVTAGALVGYWFLRRWGLWLILIGTMARVAVGVAGVLPLRLSDLLGPGVIALGGLLYLRRLS